MNASHHPTTLVIGASGFCRTVVSTLQRAHSARHASPDNTSMGDIRSTQFGGARAALLSERPSILIVGITAGNSLEEIEWLRTFFADTRSRFQHEVYCILAVTTPSRLTVAGSLLFEGATSLEPSGFIDTLVIAPPRRLPNVPSLEAQIIDAVRAATADLERRAKGGNPLPALWEPDWVPALCDPASRDTWMRWLPRFAGYVNENPLIVGPTGSGKTRLARAIHALSNRTGPFVSITPRDFSSTELVQAELFGAVAGAYTGAVEKWGLVKKAEAGTLFIDELQSIDFDLQGKLITFIENKRYRRVGEADSHTADVRFVFATNRCLQELVASGNLRDDFAYRLERLQIELAPLAARKLDIAAGAAFALAKVTRERHSAALYQDRQFVEGFSPGGFHALFSGAWPGNLRQLENTIAKLVEFANASGERLISEELTLESIHSLLGGGLLSSRDIYEQAASATRLHALEEPFVSLDAARDWFADCARSQALLAAGGNSDRAAELLGEPPELLALYQQSRVIQ